MSEFFLDAEKVKIEFPDGNWVEVKEELTQSDQDYIMSQMTRTSGTEKVSLVLELGQLPLLERSITDWSFANNKGEKIPITRDTISRLRLRYRTKVLLEVNRLNEKALEFVRKN